MNRTPFEIDEWYHCYNRGVDKRDIFMSEADYERFLALLYVANDRSPIHLRTVSRGSTSAEIFGSERGERLVNVGVFTLIPNHFHLLLREITEGGIALFMQKLGTAYTMYFNTLYERTGSLFGGRFKSKHIADDRYLKRVVNYIHGNVAELIEPGWEEGIVRDRKSLRSFMNEYRYSSFRDYGGGQPRPESEILSPQILLDHYDDETAIAFNSIVNDARTFAREKKSNSFIT